MSNRPNSNPKSVARFGYLLILLTFFGVGGWAATARLDSAVIAPGRVVLESNRQAVQHLEGGIVDRIHVREGDFVEEGQLLIEMNRVTVRSDLEVLTLRRSVSKVLETRLLAERDLSGDLIFSEDLNQSDRPQIIEAISDQRTAFNSRRLVLESQTSALRSRIDQLEAQIDGLEIQRNAIERRLEIQAGLLDRSRQGGESGAIELNTLSRREDAYIQLEAELGGVISSIAAARLQQNETEMQIVQVEREYRERASESLEALRQELTELDERIIVAEDALNRTYVMAPAAGAVQDVAVHTEGAVISPGAVLMEIVPDNERFLVSANVPPQYIDNLSVGFSAEIRFTAITDKIPEIAMGLVETISRDVVRPENSNEPPYYLARLSINESSVPESIRERVTAGMPVEVIVSTGERTVLAYLVDPLADAIRVSMREE